MDKVEINKRNQLEKYMTVFHKTVVKFVQEQKGLKDFKPFLKMDWSTRRTRSRGGHYKKGPGVNYAMLEIQRDMALGRFLEYKSFEQDPYIGSVETDDETLIFKAVSCHELAHAICGFLDNNNKEGHGKRWKEWYKKLRVEFINDAYRKSKKS